MKLIRSFFSLIVLYFGAAPLLYAQQDGGSLPSSLPQQQQASSMATNSEALGDSLDKMGIKKYQVGPGDVLFLKVYGEPQFDGPLVVDDEGNIEVPFIETPVPARCRTDREIKQDIVSALSKFLKKPQVSLRLAEARSRPPAVVFGAVRSASRVQMNRRVRLLELLSVTGGVTEQAGGDIQVFHTEKLMCPEPEELVMAERPELMTPEDPLQVPFTIYKLSDLRLGKKEANPLMRPGDIVIVTEASPVYVTGAVISPQGLYLRDKMSLTRAIAMVGGISPSAKDEVRIYRQKLGTLEPEIIKVNYSAIRKQKERDIELKPYDIIEVPGSSAFSKKNLVNTILGFGVGGVATVATQIPLRVIY